MPRKPKRGRPKPWAVGDVRVRAVRGPRGGGEWYWRGELHAERRTVYTGWATEAAAKVEVARLVAEGLPEPVPGDAEPTITTVGHLMQAWYAGLEDDRPDLAPGSLKAYKLSCRHVRDVARDLLLERFGPRELESVRGQLLRRHAPRTAKTDLDRLRAAWEWGRPRGIVPDRRLPDVEVKVPDPVRRTPTPGEVAAVLRHVQIPWRHLGLRLLYSTGARIGEIAALTRDGVDLERGLLTLEGKTGQRLVPLRPELVSELTAWLDAHERPEVLGVTFHAVRVGLARELRRSCAAAGVTPFSPHALRRAAVDQLARAGVDVKTAAQLLGHTPEVMLEHYRQVTESDLRDAVARARLGTLPEGQVVQLRTAGRESDDGE